MTLFIISLFTLLIAAQALVLLGLPLAVAAMAIWTWFAGAAR